MIHRMLAVIAVITVVLTGILGFWYLNNPDLWNIRGIGLHLFLDAEETSEAEIFESGEQTQSLRDDLIALSSSYGSLFTEGNVDTACTRTPSAPVAPTAASPVYRWIDDRGGVSFGDRPPASGTFELYDSQLPSRMDFFRLQVDFRNQATIPFFQSRVEVGARSIYEILSDLVREDYLRRTDLTVLIFPDREGYLDYSALVTGQRLGDSNGFYTSSTNQAVTFRFQDDDDTLSVTQHESLHVIMRGMFGIVPLWLNEGLAEYFEQLTVVSQYARVNPEETWLRMARDSTGLGYPADLSDFMVMSGEQWNSNYKIVNYALGWALVFFLMDSQEGRTTLSALLEELSLNYCDSINSPEVISRSYSGGFRQFEENFYRWLRNDGSNKRPHVY